MPTQYGAIVHRRRVDNGAAHVGTTGGACCYRERGGMLDTLAAFAAALAPYPAHVTVAATRIG